jgi:hypothetical protein
MVAQAGPVKHLRAGAQPAVLANLQRAFRAGPLLQRQGRDIIQIVFPAAEQIRERGHHAVVLHRQLVRRKHDAVGRETHVFADGDVAVLAIEVRVAPDVNAVSQDDAPVVGALGIDHGAVVEHHTVAQHDLVGMADRDVLAEHHLAPAGLEQRGIELHPQEQPQRPAQTADEREQDLRPDNLAQAHVAVHQRAVRARRRALRDFLDLEFRRFSHNSIPIL